MGLAEFFLVSHLHTYKKNKIRLIHNVHLSMCLYFSVAMQQQGIITKMFKASTLTITITLTLTFTPHTKTSSIRWYQTCIWSRICIFSVAKGSLQRCLQLNINNCSLIVSVVKHLLYSQKNQETSKPGNKLAPLNEGGVSELLNKVKRSITWITCWD